MTELIRSGVAKAGPQGYEFNTRALQNILANPDKGDALLKRLGPELAQEVVDIVGRGTGRGFGDITKEGPTPFLTGGGAMARLRAYIGFPEFVGHPTRPYEFGPTARALTRYGTQGAAGAALLPEVPQHK